MSRPQRVYPKQLPLFNLQHTKKHKMYCGVELIGLHLIKETPEYYVSIDCWAGCCSQYKEKKKNVNLSVDIPVVTDERTKSFLNTHAWHDWVAKELATTQVNIFSKDKEIVPHTPDSDTIETLALLDKLFPEKKKIYFYELESIISSYCHGSFISYDDNGNVEEPTKGDLKSRCYYTRKYNGLLGNNDIPMTAEVKALYDAYHAIDRDKDKNGKSEAYRKYADAEDKYLFENHNLTDVFLTIGQNAVICPYIYTHCCVKGSAYENAGDIYFIVTDDSVYFDDKRHF